MMTALILLIVVFALSFCAGLYIADHADRKTQRQVSLLKLVVSRASISSDEKQVLIEAIDGVDSSDHFNAILVGDDTLNLYPSRIRELLDNEPNLRSGY